MPPIQPVLLGTQRILRSPAETAHAWKPTLRFICCVTLACCTLAGCTGSKPTPGPATAAGAAKAVATAKSQQLEQAADLLNSILEMLKLETLGTSSQADDVVALMNQWLRFSQGNKPIEEEEALDEPVLEAWRARLSEAQVKRVRRTTFQRPDLDRLQNLLLMNAVVKHAVGKGKSDLERISNVFEHLVTNTELVASQPDDVPLSPYHLYLLGRTTAADRAWLFVEMLRQLKLTAVILSAPQPKDAEDWDPNQPFLIAALIDKQVYLFDPRLGLPLTVPSSDGAPSSIATLEQARGNPEILKQYAVGDKPYAITADLLKEPTVYVVGETSLWSYRFARLQKAFTGARAAVISESLISVDRQPGTMSRVADWPAKQWDGKQIAVWPYSESRLSALESLSAQHEQVLGRITDGLKMPIVVEQGQQDGQPVERRRPTNLMFLARLDHASGKLDEAVMGYTRVRVQMTERLEVQEIKDRLRYAYMLAGEDSLFWTALAKFDQGTKNDHRVAIDKLKQYLKAYPMGQWIDLSHILLAHIAAESGDFKTAEAELNKVSADHPQAQGVAFLKRKWTQMNPAPAK